MMKVANYISVILGLLLITSVSVSADGYGEFKEKVKSGDSEVYNSFLGSFPGGKEKSPNADYEQDSLKRLMEDYSSWKSWDTSEEILSFLPYTNSEDFKLFKELDDQESIKMIGLGMSDTDITALVAVRSKGIASAVNNWKAALNSYPQALYLMDIMKSYLPFSEGMSLGVGKEYQREMIQMYYPGPGMLGLRGKVADLDLEIGQDTFKASVRDVVADTESLLAEIRHKEEMIQINTESARLLRTMADVTEVQYKSGTKSFADLVRMKSELKSREDKVDRISAMKSGLHAKLLAMLNLPLDIPVGEIEWSDEINPPIDAEQLMNELADSRQELKIMDAKYRKMTLMIEMGYLRVASDKTGGLSFYQGREVTALGKSEMKEMSGDMDMGMTGEMKMDMSSMNFMKNPMTDFRNTDNAIDLAWVNELIEKRNAMGEMLQGMTDMSQGMLDMNLKKYKQMIESEKVYSNRIIPDTRAALDVVKKGYSADENSFNDLVGAEMSLLMARMELADISRDRRLAKIELERLTGRHILQ